MSSTFFTNKDKNTLKNKINNIIKNYSDIEYLDFVIGYFSISGFNQISQNLSQIKKIRILIGISTDKATYEASKLIEIFSQDQTRNIDDNIYKNFQSMKQLIENKKIEIRIIANKDVHAKMYIMRSDEKTGHTDEKIYTGKVIIGSSNLTLNGLEKNTEINAELTQERDISEAVEIFENLWADSVELTEDDFEKYITPKLPKQLEKESEKYNDVFYQSLIKYFENIIDNDIEIDSEIKLFNYQKDAVNSAVLKLNRYGGAILGDVVGLGKTVVAVAVLKVLNYKALIIAPPATHSQWKDTLQKFHLTEYNVVSFDKLQKITDEKIVVIDESHKLKDHKSLRYERVQELCKFPFRKKVLLLSATLQNNSPEDIANQIYLFQDKNSSTLPNIVSLEEFFAPHIKKYKSLKELTNKEEINTTLKEISSEIRTNILRPLLIRRTRTDIESYEMYKNDIEEFPKLSKLNSLEYKLGSISKNFTETIDYLENRLHYERFRVLNNLNDNGKNRYREHNPNISDNIFNDNDLSTLAKYALIKRFESSIVAFKISLESAISQLRQFIKDLENDKLYIGKDSSLVLTREESKREYIYENDKIYYIKKTKLKEKKVYLKGLVIEKNDIKKPSEYLDSLQVDLSYLIHLQDIWKDVKYDPKFDKFLEIIKLQKNEKLVIFTEYTDTLEYLQTMFYKHNIQKTLFINSQNRKEYEEEIASNFDANYEKHRDDYNILITTDTLAEGVNLHRSNTIINYDLPWNSTKLMQRMGRVNRIGSKFDTISVSNFKPVDESNKIIGLLEKSFIKLQSFHYTLGEDSKVLFDDEVVESFGIDEDKDEELEYLQIIREFKKEYPQRFETLKGIEEESVLLQGDTDQELSFFKVDIVSYFYKKTNNYQLIDFLTFIKEIENKTKIKDINSKIEDTIKYHIAYMNIKEFTKNDLKNKFSKKDREAMKILKEWYQKKDFISEELFVTLEELLKSKTSHSFAKKMLDLKGKTKEEINQELLQLTVSHKENTTIINMHDIKSKIFVKIGT